MSNMIGRARPIQFCTQDGRKGCCDSIARDKTHVRRAKRKEESAWRKEYAA